MAPRFLLDASAVYPLVATLREEFVDHARLFAVLDLTAYEVGNALLKEYRKGRVRDLDAAFRLFESALSYVTVLNFPGLSEVLKLAYSENLTFYDAAYLYSARARGMRLVIEDRDLLRFPESINVRSLLEALGTGSEIT